MCLRESRFVPEKLSGNHKIFSRNIESLECYSKLFFSFSESIDFSSIKEVDSKWVGFLDKISGSLLPRGIIRIQPVSKGYRGYLQTTISKKSIFHFYSLSYFDSIWCSTYCFVLNFINSYELVVGMFRFKAQRFPNFALIKLASFWILSDFVLLGFFSKQITVLFFN